MVLRLCLAAVLLVAGCTGSSTPAVVTPTFVPPTQFVTRPSPAAARPKPTLVEVRYRIVRHTTDAATAAFATTVDATLHDSRGWQRAGFRLVHDDRAKYVVVLGEAAEVQKLCEPYDVYRKYSCQNGPVVALNADRWRVATPEWTGSLAGYRQMLINHEFGHLLGMHHPPAPQCPRAGRLARVMSQQSTELNGCLPNPWPLPSEIALASRHVLPLAPPATP